MRPCRPIFLMHLKVDNAPVARINPAKAFWRRKVVAAIAGMISVCSHKGMWYESRNLCELQLVSANEIFLCAKLRGLPLGSSW